jgi:hypothetical protein
MKLRCVFNDLMRKHHRQGVLLGQTTAATAETYFGFHAGEVERVHLHKQGIGKGVWFRLRCGRVIDETARPCRADALLYDHAALWG